MLMQKTTRASSRSLKREGTLKENSKIPDSFPTLIVGAHEHVRKGCTVIFQGREANKRLPRKRRSNDYY